MEAGLVELSSICCIHKGWRLGLFAYRGYVKIGEEWCIRSRYDYDFPVGLVLCVIFVYKAQNFGDSFIMCVHSHYILCLDSTI